MPKATAAEVHQQPIPAPDKVANRQLWDRLFKTDPDATKPFTRGGGFKGTAIKPYWCMMRMTEEFGPVGQGWGWDELEHLTFVNTDGLAVWFSKVQVWYRIGDDEFNVGPQWGATELVAKRSSGQFLDEEAAKKAVTDGITKCCSYLGLAGDVHMGLFDDSKYVDERKDEQRSSTVKVAPEAITLWRDTVVASAKACKTSDDLKHLWDGERGQWKTHAASKDQATKAAANYVKSQVERRAAELKQDGAAEGTGKGEMDEPGADDAHPTEQGVRG